MKKVFIVGGGVFGLSTSIELAQRGYDVTLFERGKMIPASDSNSNDISRIVRMDYSDNEKITLWSKEAIARWKKWNQLCLKDGFSDILYHESGVLLLSKDQFDSHQGYEFLSYKTVTAKSVNANIQRLNNVKAGDIYSSWSKGEGKEYKDGYINYDGGWANASLAMAWMASYAKSQRVKFICGNEGKVAKILKEKDQVIGVLTEDGKTHHCENVIVAMGAWSESLVKELKGKIQAVAQPVVYFQVPPTLKEKFSKENFPVFAADIARTGWYGFPIHNNLLLKVGHHGNGYLVLKKDKDDLISLPDSNIPVPQKVVDRTVNFVKNTFPDLREAQVEKSRFCWYCDSFDGEFIVDFVPGTKGLMVACGDSGHGFKFAPVLGEMISDIFEKKKSIWTDVYRWREPKNEKKVESTRLKNSPAEVVYSEVKMTSKL